MTLPENPRDIAEDLVAALSDGRRTPQEVLSGPYRLESWDLAALEALVQELREANHAGRLSDRDFGTLRLVLTGWLRVAADDDPDATVELETQLPASTSMPGVDLADLSLELRPGSLLRGRYLLDEVIARGGQSLIYRARDLRREASAGEAPNIAVKVLRDELRGSARAIARLRREFRQTQSLRHAGVVRMYDLDCEHDAWFISMELLAGTSLANRLKRSAAAPLERAEATRIATACADVLTYAHRQGIPHGDFKPGNVFLEDRGGMKVLDFGAAPDSIATSNEATSAGDPISPIVTRAYASPEVLAGQVAEPRDDLFSFACVVYELISGRHPFNRLPANAARDASLAPQPLSQLSAAQNAALASALAWTRAERPKTVADLTRSLLNDGGTVSKVQASPLAPSKLASGSPPWRWIVALLAAGSLIVTLSLRTVDEDSGHAIPIVQEHAAPATAPPTSTLESGDDGMASNSTATTGPPAPANIAPPPQAPTQQAPARSLAKITADSASISVSESASVAVILLRRQGDLGSAVQAAWRLSSGTARAQEDFDGPTTGSTRFLAGQATRAIYVPLINDSTREGDKSFTLTLSARSAVVGPIGTVTVTIVDDD